MQKRSLIIAGHSTSMALEPEFWAALETLAAERGTSVAHIIAEIDEHRQGANLSSAVRVTVLEWFIARAVADA
ncbi:ribbon-helix-helix domain-containing protein [Pelagibacterium limicola]|uniref:ribbon-helix-helix domain-containing protein n=1 Tax=Pelagibacterium limicola TaxID=2791022 RepID=UPI0018B01123